MMTHSSDDDDGWGSMLNYLPRPVSSANGCTQRNYSSLPVTRTTTVPRSDAELNPLSEDSDNECDWGNMSYMPVPKKQQKSFIPSPRCVPRRNAHSPLPPSNNEYSSNDENPKNIYPRTVLFPPELLTATTTQNLESPGNDTFNAGDDVLKSVASEFELFEQEKSVQRGYKNMASIVEKNSTTEEGSENSLSMDLNRIKIEDDYSEFTKCETTLEDDESDEIKQPLFRTLFNIDDVMEKKQYLVAEFRARESMRDPFGALYDPGNNLFIVTSSKDNEVLFYPFDDPSFGVTYVLANKKMHGLHKPTAVAIVEYGRKYVILDGNHIFIMEFCEDLSREKLFNEKVVSTHAAKCRGIAVTPMKNILTYNSDFKSIVIYDANATDVILARLQYSYAAEGRAAAPSFMSMCGPRLVITDLGGGQGYGARISAYDVIIITDKYGNKTEQIFEHGGFYNRAADSLEMPAPGEFQYVSGVQVDAEGWMLVGDAVLGTVQIINSSGEGVAQIHFEKPFHCPYLCGLAMNGNGELLLTGRGSHEQHISMYKITVKDTAPPYCRPGKRIGGTGGKRNGGRRKY